MEKYGDSINRNDEYKTLNGHFNNLKSITSDEKSNIVVIIKNILAADSFSRYLTVSERDTLMNRLQKANLSKLTYTVMEMQTDNSGLIIDFDLLFKTQEEANNVMKSRSKIYRFVVKKLLKIIDKTFEDVDTFMLYITSKTKIVKKEDQYKYGFHFVLPQLLMTKAERRYILNELSVDRAMTNTFERYKCTDKLNKIIDPMSASFPTQLYGSSKPTTTPYELTHAFRCDVDTDMETGEVMLIAEIEDIDNKTNYVKELSILPDTTTCEPKFTPIINQDIKLPEVSAQVTDISMMDQIENLMYGDNDAELLFNLLDMLPEECYTQYVKWFSILKAIYNINPAYRPIALWFTMKSPKYSGDESWFDRKWLSRSNSGGIRSGMGGIKYQARQHNEEMYLKIIKKSDEYRLMTLILYGEGELSDAGIAIYLKYKFGDVYKYAKNLHQKKDNRWFKFDSQYSFVWEDIGETNSYLSRYLYTEFSQKLRKIQESIYEEIKAAEKNEEENDEGNKKKKSKKSKQITFKAKVCKNLNFTIKKILSSAKKLNSVEALCKLEFEDPKFLKEIDTNSMYIGCRNGVVKYDKKGKGVLVRETHNVAINKRIDANFIKFDAKDPVQKHILKIFKSHFPDNEIDTLLYYMMYSAQCVSKMVNGKKFLIMQGGGNNGKTALLERLSVMLGNDLSYRCPMAMFTGKSATDSSSHTAAIFGIKGKSFVFCEESNKGSSLNTSRVKTFGCPGTIYCRGLRRNGENVENNAIYILSTNLIPVFNEINLAMKTRLRFMKMLNAFVSPNIYNASEDNPYLKLGDSSIGELFKKQTYKDGLFAVYRYFHEKLYTHYGNLDNVESNTVEQSTDNYLCNANKLYEFVNRNLVTVDDTKLKELYELKDEDDINKKAKELRTDYGRITTKDFAARYKKWLTEVKGSKKFNEKEVIAEIAEFDIGFLQRKVGDRYKSVNNTFRIIDHKTDKKEYEKPLFEIKKKNYNFDEKKWWTGLL